MQMVEMVSKDEKEILDKIRRLTNHAEKVSYIQSQRDLYTELEQVYHLLNGAAENMMYAKDAGDVRLNIEQARDQIYRLLR